MKNNETYGLDDLFFIAMKIEQDGKAFYRLMAQRADDQKRREIFVYLAD